MGPSSGVKEPDLPITSCPVCGRSDFKGEYGIGVHLARYCENATEEDREFGRELMCGDNHPMTGFSMPKSAKRAIGESSRGRSLSKETRKKISESLKGHEVSEETRRKISESLQGEKIPWFGVTGEDHPLYGYEWSDEQLKQLSEASSGENAPWYGVTGKDHPSHGVTGNDHPMYGYEWSEEQLQQLSESHKGLLSAGTPQIRVNETGTTVRSGWEAEIDLLLHDSGITYEYEAETFDLGDYTYTPDFICEEVVVIEVKGYVWDGDSKKSIDFMETYPEYKYLVVGSELPSHHYLPWDSRADLPDLIRSLISK